MKKKIIDYVVKKGIIGEDGVVGIAIFYEKAEDVFRKLNDEMKFIKLNKFADLFLLEEEDVYYYDTEDEITYFSKFRVDMIKKVVESLEWMRFHLYCIAYPKREYPLVIMLESHDKTLCIFIAPKVIE